MPDTRRLLRPEAELRSWTDLTDPQRKAILRLHELLEELIKQPLRTKGVPKGPLAPLQLPNIDPHRVSNVFLLDGGRGSGKTSVLVTLLHLWQELLERDDGQLSLFATEAETAVGEAAADSHADELRELLRARGPLMGRLLPLPILDLQPLPSSTTLLMWLASRLNELVRALMQASGEEDCDENRRASWLSRGETELASRKAWREFLQVAALGSDGNLAARKGQLDPSAYAEELEETELGRIEITQRWHRLIEALQKDLHARYPRLKNDVRLVIPLDDADLNPQRCMELLDLVRTLLHPGVIFLLAGDSELFRKVLRGQYVRILLGPVSHLPLDEASSEVKALLERDPTPRALANAFYDKVVPLGHRLALGKLLPHERLNMLRSTLERFDTRKLRDPGDEELRPKTLAESFDLVIEARERLPGYLRTLLDMQRLLELQETETGAAKIFQILWRAAVEEIGDEVGDEAGKVFSNVFEVTSHGELAIRTLYRASLRFRPLGELFWVSDGLTLNAVTQRTIKLTPTGGHLFLDDRLVALFLIGEDLADPLLEPLSDEDEAITDRGVLSRSVVSSIIVNDGGQQLDFMWPLPAWPLALDHMRFFHLWESWTQPICDKLHAGMQPSQSDAEWLAWTYVRLVAAVARDRAITEGTPSYPAEQTLNWVSLWRELYEQSKSSFPIEKLSARQYAFRDWVQSRAALLAAPESGLPAQVANQLLMGWLAAASPQDREWTIAQRERRVALALNPPASYRPHNPQQPFLPSPPGLLQSADRILDYLDERHRAHEWSRLIKEGMPNTENITQVMRLALSSLRVVTHRFSTATSRGTLGSYLGLLGLQISLIRGNAQWEEELLVCLKDHESTDGTAEIALKELWSLAKKHDMDTDPSLIDRWWAELERFGRQPTEFPKQLLIERDSVPWGARWSIQLFRNIQYQAPQGLGDHLSAVLALAHEVLVDEWDVPTMKIGKADAVPPFWLCGLTVHYRGGDFQVPWPLPRWQALTDRLYIGRSLLTVVENARRYLGKDEQTQQKAIDGLLYAQLNQICEEIFRNVAPDKLAPRLTLNLHPDDWRNIAEKLLNNLHGPNRDGYRHKATADWIKRECALMATPETGLSYAASQSFLDMLLRWDIKKYSFPQSINPDRDITSSPKERKDAWIQARRDRLQASITVAERNIKVDTLLGHIQRSDPNHPWYRLVESPAGA